MDVVDEERKRQGKVNLGMVINLVEELVKKIIENVYVKMEEKKIFADVN